MERIEKCSVYANSLGIEVHAGHGLDYKTTKILSKIREIKEFNIGHYLIGESIFHGLKKVINNFKKIIKNWMRIFGIGVDIVKNRRINLLTKKKKFVERTFSINEINYFKKYKNNSNYYSKRFAAKEAFSKALGTGIRNDLNFKDIEILNDKLGKPYFLKNKKINNLISKRFKTKKYNLFLSISDEKDYSIAFTIIQKQ